MGDIAGEAEETSVSKEGEGSRFDALGRPVEVGTGADLDSGLEHIAEARHQEFIADAAASKHDLTGERGQMEFVIQKDGLNGELGESGEDIEF